jgi:hypothetical protein
MKGARRR